jgi:hypothetical protein
MTDTHGTISTPHVLRRIMRNGGIGKIRTLLCPSCNRHDFEPVPVSKIRIQVTPICLGQPRRGEAWMIHTAFAYALDINNESDSVTRLNGGGLGVRPGGCGVATTADVCGVRVGIWVDEGDIGACAFFGADLSA